MSDEIQKKLNAASSTDIHCIICTAVIPVEHARKKGVVTCPREAGSASESPCQKAYRERRRAILNSTRKKCRSCGAPVSAEERVLFRQWRKETESKKKGRPKKAKDDTLVSATQLPDPEGVEPLAIEPAAFEEGTT